MSRYVNIAGKLQDSSKFYFRQTASLICARTSERMYGKAFKISRFEIADPIAFFLCDFNRGDGNQ